jgi:RND superfamily putative drug exporter
MDERHDDGRRWARGLAAVVVALRWLIIPAWIAAAVAAALYLPGLGGEASDASGLVKTDSTAIAAEARSPELFGTPLLTEIALVQRAPHGLTADATARIGDRARRITADHALASRGLLGAIPVINVGGALSDRRERSTTAVTYLYFDPALTFERRVAVAHDLIRTQLTHRDDAPVGVTGVVPARVEQSRAIRDALPAITVGTLLLILFVVGVWQRSLVAPLVTLASAGIAYLVAVGVVGWFGQKTGRALPQEVDPLILVLVLGIVTDYCVFLLAGTRRRMRAGDGRRDAARGAAATIAPTILTAGLIVAGGTASLSFGTLGFFRALGPALAIAAGVGTLVALTLVPAVLAIVARGPRTAEPETEAEPVSSEPALHRRLARSRLVALPVALLCVAGLAYATGDLRQVRLGFSLTEGLTHGSEARRAAEAAGAGFSGGIISPTEVQLLGPGIATNTAAIGKVEAGLRRIDGVSSVVGPAEQARAASAPGAVQAVRATADGTMPTPFTAPSGDAVRLLVVPRADPFSSGAITTIEHVRDALPGLLRDAGLPDTRTALAGQTALAEETIDQARSDIARLALIALAVNLLMLVVFLRALVAPVVLLGASVLALGAALGIAALVSRLLGWGDIAYFTPLAAAVLLLSLGSDYNVFVVGRIWDEARHRSVADAVATAVPRAAKPITLAGLVLAGSFALLALAPVISLRQLAVTLAAGVLLDAFVVRSLLVPSLLTSLGPVAGWPGRALRRGADADAPRAVPLGAGADD